MNTTYPNTTVDQALLQEVEEVAERWLTGSLSEEILHAALRVLRPDLPADDRWQLWLDYTGALSEWHTAPGWAENARQSAVRAAGDLIGGESL